MVPTLIWVGGGLLAVLTGALPMLRAATRRRAAARASAEFTARAAVRAALISRDGATAPNPEAEDLLHRAELLLGSSVGARAAATATELARSADRLWSAT